MTVRALPMARLLTRRLAWIALAVLLANLALIWAYYGSDIEALQDEMIVREMARLEAALVAQGDGAYRVAPTARGFFDAHPEAYAFALIDATGRILDTANPELIPQDALADTPFAGDWVARLPDGTGRILVASHEVGPAAAGLSLLFVVRSDPADLLTDALLAELVGHTLVPLVPAILLLLGANALMVRRSLAPVSRAAEWARAQRPGQAGNAAPPDTALTEINDLLDATRRSLARLAEALSAEKRRAAEAAHVLRTPLAALIARLDQLPEGPAAARLRSDMAELSQTVRQILASANADAVVLDEDARADLAEIAEDVVAKLAPVAIRQGAELELLRDEPLAQARGDTEAIALALTNLVENAVFHAGGRITVTVGPGASLSVRDRGPGLPAGDTQRLFEAFWRGPGASVAGSGLGLSIVERVLRAHGGAVAARNHPEGGAAFRLDFPTAD